MEEELNYISGKIEHLDSRIAESLEDGYTVCELTRVMHEKAMLENILNLLTEHCLQEPPAEQPKPTELTEVQKVCNHLLRSKLATDRTACVHCGATLTQVSNYRRSLKPPKPPKRPKGRNLSDTK